MKQIQIDGISQDKVQFGTKITLESGKEKYSFFNSKKDGGETKAYEQFKRFGFGIGDVVFAEVKEEQKSFKGDEGNDIKYTQRTILYFEDPNAGGDTQKQPLKRPTSPEKTSDKGFTPTPTNSSIKGDSEVLVIVKQLSAEVNGLRIRVEKLEGKNPF